MDLRKVTTIIRKEWSEVFYNRLVLFTVAFLPIILTALPLVTLAFLGDSSEMTELQELNSAGGLELFAARCEGLNEFECAQLYLLDIYTLMFMILPVAIPVTIAAYSIVGEKATHSLEPLLATPITTVELLLGKTVAAVMPAILVTWLAYGIYLFAVRLVVSAPIFNRMLDAMWLIAIFVVGPLLTLLAVNFAIMVSSRVSDPRIAEQISTVVILPIILLIVGQSVGFLLLSRTLVIFIAVVVALLDAMLIFLAIKLFQREVILTRWK